MKRRSLFLIAVLIVLVSDLVNAQGVLLNNIVVKTMAGKVRGRLTNGIIIFKNIPYAASGPPPKLLEPTPNRAGGSPLSRLLLAQAVQRP